MNAVKILNMMETGFSINTDELSKQEVELINMIKSQLNKKKIKNQKKMQQQLGGQF